MSMRPIIVTALIVLPLACIALAQSGSERLRLIRADVLKRENVRGQVQQVLEGNVEFRQGETTIKCDMARHLLERDEAALIGHVRIFDETRTLTADTVYIHQKEEKQIALGNVISVTEKDTTFADRMTYLEAQDKVISEGHVRIVDVAQNSIVTGGRAEYWREKEYGLVVDGPVLTRLDSLGQPSLRIRADTLETLDDRTLASGDVEIVQGRMQATCGEAVRFNQEDRIELYQQPEVLHKSYEIAGDTLKLRLRDSKLQKAIVIGNAVATSEADTLSPGRWVNRLSGEQMEFTFQDDDLTQIVVENQASSLYHIIEDEKYKGANEVTGDRIVIDLEEDKAERVRVASNPDVATGKFAPPQ